MKQFTISLVSGTCLTAFVFALHLLVQRYLPWQDKPGMPDAFANLLFPGYVFGQYVFGSYIGVSPFLQFAIPATIDCLLVSSVVWLALAFARVVGKGYNLLFGLRR